MRAGLLLGASLLGIVSAGEATAFAAEETSRFGAPRQLVLSADLPFGSTAPQIGILHRSYSGSDFSITTFSFMPSADFFVAPHVSLGLLLGYVRTTLDRSVGGSSSTASASAFAFGARIGYDFAFSEQVSFWPRLSLLGSYSLSGNASTVDSSTSTRLMLSAFAPVLWHPATHFFVGGGPVVATDLYNESEGQDLEKTTAFGAQILLGGYFGGV